jgi:hypothetical protein
VKPKSMTLLPPAPGNCQVCAAYHHPDEPHNLRSLYYQIKFQQEHGRPPTWDDALAHCQPDVQTGVREVLRRRGLLSNGDNA